MKRNTGPQITTRKVAGGTITVAEYGPGRVTRLRRRAIQALQVKQNGQRGLSLLVSAGPGRFHGDPVNAFTRQVGGRNSKPYEWIPTNKKGATYV